MNGPHIGAGCTTMQSGLPHHNPKPYTTRGKRKHNNRDDSAKKRAEAAWNRDRSTNPSRYQLRMAKRAQKNDSRTQG